MVEVVEGFYNIGDVKLFSFFVCCDRCVCFCGFGISEYECDCLSYLEIFILWLRFLLVCNFDRFCVKVDNLYLLGLVIWELYMGKVLFVCIICFCRMGVVGYK